MALVLIKEDGSGLVDANAYASVADGDAYHEGHLYATAWTTATADKKAAALVMATRLIDALFQFSGVRTKATQALQWPREDCPDPDANPESVGQRFVLSDVVPKAVVDATCESARALIIEDRTANPLGEGLKFSSLGDLQQSFDKSDRKPMVPRLALAMLAKYGALPGQRSGAVKLVRA
ncbi:MAG: hypothetical protein RLY20_2235 [Verrucomicrobiota bacterium]|jgi:hypothetical protein